MVGNIIETILFFILGISVGSFLNVLIDRIPRDEEFISSRSRCDNCRKTLKWYDLIPLFSFLLLSAKCRYCRKKISFQYPLIELITGILFILCFVFYRSDLIYLLLTLTGLLVIFVTDLKYSIIPDKILIFLTAVTFIFNFLFGYGDYRNILTGLFMFFLFFILVLFTKGKGMGFGDVKYAFFMGVYLGYPKIIVGFYISFLTGAAVSLILVLIGRKTMKSAIPFGPFLVAGTAVSYLYGMTIWNFTRGVLGI